MIEKILCCLTACLLALTSTALGQSSHDKTPPEDKPAENRFDPVVQDIEGWTVYVDPAMLEGEYAERGGRALKMLANHLQRIKILVPSPQIELLQSIEIWIERAHPRLGAMQYHPSKGWLVSHGYDPRLARKVHITHADELLSRGQMLKHPAVILHELAHGYHDQFLGFDNPEIIAAYEKAKAAGILENVLLYTGKYVQHYGLTNHKEYFAEGTEAFFYRNDFYPFVRAELQEFDPTLCELLKKIWEQPPDYAVVPLSRDVAEEYKLDTSFYKKCARIQGILIATSDRVSDFAIREAAYQFDMIMQRIDPGVAKRIRQRRVLCLLIGADEYTSDLPQFASDKTGEDLDFYNWRNRGFLSWPDGRPTVVFAEEDVLEYEGGMQLESILIHEFAHVIHGAGFDKALQERLTETFEQAKAQGLWNDGRAAQRFRRVTSEKPVLLLDALIKAFPDQPPKLLKACLDGGDILVNGESTNSKARVTKDDKVLIVFGGPKQCYAGKNRAEYWAEGVQDWYDTNRTMDHDHNHIHTREQLIEYDPGLAELCRDVLGDSPWRFVSPRERAGKGHLKGFDPNRAPVVKAPKHIKEAANDYYDEYWKDYWQRLRDKYPDGCD